MGVGKEGTKMPKKHTNTATVTALELETARSRLLLWKLGFLKRILSDGATGVGVAAVGTLVDDVGSLCLVEECRELEEKFGTHFTERILSGNADQISRQDVKKVIGRLDRKKRIELCEKKAPWIAEVAKNGGWLRLWDIALDLEERHTRGLQMVSRQLSIAMAEIENLALFVKT